MFVIFPAPRVSPSLEVASTMALCFTEVLMPGWSFTSSTASRTSSVSSRWHTRGLAPTDLEVTLGSSEGHTAPLAIAWLDLEALFHLRLRWLRRAVPAHAVRWLFLQACVLWHAATCALLEESILPRVPSWSPPTWCHGSLVELVPAAIAGPFVSWAVGAVPTGPGLGRDQLSPRQFRSWWDAAAQCHVRDRCTAGLTTRLASSGHAQRAAAFSHIAGGEPQTSLNSQMADR